VRGYFARFGLAGEPGTAEFWDAASHLRLPVSVPAEDGGWSTLFLWRGSPATLRFETWSAPVELRRLGDSDCWFAEVPMPARLRVTYHFHDGDPLDGAHADPLNPVGAGGNRSIAATPDAEAQPYWPAVGPDDVLPIPGTRIRWASEHLGGRRTVRVHQAGAPGPVVLLLDGDDWMYAHPAVTAFDAAVANGDMPAATLVFLPTPHVREAEYGCEPALWQGIRDELLPLLADNGVPVDLGKLVVAGQSLGGLSALWAAVEFPDLVSRVACQSGSFWWTSTPPDLPDPLDGPRGGDIAARLRDRPDLSGLRVAFDVGEHEPAMIPHCELVETLAARAGATVRASRSTSGHDRAGWRHALVRDVAWALADD
jgi:enterochelin esterase-like enzyme